MKSSPTLFGFALFALLATLPPAARSQATPYAELPSVTTNTVPVPPTFTYVRPTERETFRSYVFNAYGPYAIAAAGLASGFNQLSNTPPEWHQGAKGYGRRFASNYGMGIVSTTTLYGLSEALREDPLYYRCECRGVFPRFNHAVLSTVTARRGRDGHRAISVSAVLSAYAGSAVAVYGWYPDRFGAKDVLRLGNYNLLSLIGGNVALEFLYGGPHTLFSHIHTYNPSEPDRPSH